MTLKLWKRSPRTYMTPTVMGEWDWGGDIDWDRLLTQEVMAVRLLCMKVLQMGVTKYNAWEKERKIELLKQHMDWSVARTEMYAAVLKPQEDVVWGLMLDISNAVEQPPAPKPEPPSEPSASYEQVQPQEEADEPIVVDSQRLAEDIRWVYANLEKLSLSPTSAPTPGAFTMWRMAKEDRKWFIDKMLPRALPSKIEEASSAVEAEDSMRQEALIKAAKDVLSQAADVYAG